MDSSSSAMAAEVAAELQILRQIHTFFAVALALAIISSISFGLRILTRAVILRVFKRDDWTIAAAMVFYLANCIVTLISLQFQSKITASTPASAYAELTTYIKAASGLFGLSLVMCKVSLAYFFLALFGPSQKIQRTIVYCLMVLSVVPGVVFVFLGSATCAQRITNSAEPYSCPVTRPWNQMSMIFSILGAFTDFSFTCLAIGLLWSSMMPRSAKLSAGALLILGCVGGGASITRAIIQYELLNGDKARSINLTIGMWSTVEAGVCITVACLATIRPLVRNCYRFATGRSQLSNSANTEPVSGRTAPSYNQTKNTIEEAQSTGEKPPGKKDIAVFSVFTVEETDETLSPVGPGHTVSIA